MEPPVAPRKPHVTEIHDRTLEDDWFWLRDRESQEVLDYLKAENSYTEAKTAHLDDLKKTLYDQMLGRIQEDDAGVPIPKGDWLYYWRTESGKPYRLHCRKRGEDEPEEVYLDENTLAEGHDYFRLGGAEVSPDGNLLAYSTDLDGSEKYTLRFRDLTNGQDLEETVGNVYYSLEWANDSRTVFHTTLDDAHRPFKAHRYTLGGETEEVYHEPDELNFMHIGKTRDDRFILIGTGSSTTSEWMAIPADTPTVPPAIISPRSKDVEYAVSHHDGWWYLLTNLEAKQFRLIRQRVDDPTRVEEVIAHRPEVKLEVCNLFDAGMVISEIHEGIQRLRLRDYQGERDLYVAMPEAVYSLGPRSNPSADQSVIRFSYESMVTPESDYACDLITGELELLKTKPVLGDYDQDLYETHREWAVSEDGTKVPITLVHRKDLPLDGSHPTLLYGYGSYGLPIRPGFSYTLLSLLERGFVYAIGHIRGGGYLGEHWREDGKMMRKRNTFTDFVACAEHLIARGYTNRERLAIRGGSAGGLLLGATVNMRPDLFKVVLNHVPFVDVINTMLDDSIPLTVTEYEQWGNPNEREAFDYIMSYSPYDNLQVTDYPATLVTAGLNDPRVQYWEPAKYVAKLRTLKTDSNVLLLKTNMGAGHAGKSGRYGQLEEVAFEYAFLLDQLGMVDKPASD